MTGLANMPFSGNRPRPATIQARSRDGSPRAGRVRFACSHCEITYYMREGMKPHCPLCEQKDQTEAIRKSLHDAINKHNALFNENERLKVQVDTLTAMKVALEMISTEDLTFIKSVVYRWQADRTKVALKATHAVPKRKGSRAKVDGFVALFRGGEPEVHECDSVGGVALAGYLEEATNLEGQVKAMTTLVRAVLQHLQAHVES